MIAKQPRFQFRVSVDTEEATGKVLAVYFQIRKGRQHHVKEFADGAAIADYDRDGNLLGVELIAPCSISIVDRIASNEPMRIRSSVKQFVRKSGPRELVTA